MAPRLLALIPLAVGLNLAMGHIVAALALPLFLDTAGTVLIATLVGPWPALGTAVVSQTAFAVTSGNATWLAFLPVHLLIAGYAAFAARAGAFRSVSRTVGAGLLLGLLAAGLAAPIAYFAFGGVTAGGVTAVTALLTASGLPLAWAVVLSSLVNDLLDKTVTFVLIRTALVSLPRRTAARYPEALRALGR